MDAAVLFDYGNTLTAPDAPVPGMWTLAVAAAAAHLSGLGCPGAAAPGFAAHLERLLHDRLDPIWQRGEDAPWGEVIASAFPGTEPRALERAMRRAMLAHTHLARGAAQTLRALRAAGLRLAVVSDVSCFSHSLAWELDQLGIGPYFDAVVTSGEVRRCKPASQMFASALAALAVPPQAAWMVGDWWEGDIQGARALGIRPVWRRRDPRLVCPEGGIPVIDDLPQLIPLVVGTGDAMPRSREE